MKVLFAVSSESISDAIIKRYRKDYKEILSYTNVYYFNAILKELQKDKSYDRIIISEDLEPFSNNNYDAIDKFIFEKLDNISDEAHDSQGKETSIILICSDRRTKGSSFLVKIFGIGVYNALLGSDRSMEAVCKLINKPRLKKEAKLYYKIDAEDVSYDPKNEKEVSELEITNILNHFKKISKNKDKYADSFNNIASQYTDEQLKIIINCLPINVKAVLEEECPKYQELMSASGMIQRTPRASIDAKEAQEKTGIKIDILENKLNQTKMSGPIVIPSSVKTSKNKGPVAVRPMGNPIEKAESFAQKEAKIVNKEKNILTSFEDDEKLDNLLLTDNLLDDNDDILITSDSEDFNTIEPSMFLNDEDDSLLENIIDEDVEKEDDMLLVDFEDKDDDNDLDNLDDLLPSFDEDEDDEEDISTEKKGRGRPRKTPVVIENKPKGKRGRPRKIVEVEEQEEDDSLLLDFDEEDNNNDSITPDMFLEEKEDYTLDEQDQELTEEIDLPEIDDLDDLADLDILEEFEEDDEDDLIPGMKYEDIDDDDYLLPGIESDSSEEDSLLLDFDENEELKENDTDNELNSISFEDSNFFENNNSYSEKNYSQYNSNSNTIESIKPQVDYSMSSLNSLLTKDKKIVTFLGTTKNGTSFLINNLAALFSSLGINVAILDMTKNRNSYYIYTKNEENLRKIAYTSIEKLQNGFAEGIKVDKNLTVYTSLPNDGKDYSNAEPILSTLVQNHSLILIDCDFDTNPSYFASCQEIYLVQSMDILTIQPLTAFLRDLKAKGVLESEKVRVVINKEISVRGLTTKMIIGGMSFYNDPAMSFMTELFNKDMVKACSIPFEDNAYSKYLEAMVNCNVTISGYSNNFKNKLRILGDMVYPLTSKQTYSKAMPNYGRNTFSNSMNNTLNQMKNKY